VTSLEPFSGVVLAGGRSRRMSGLDKRWEMVEGKPLLQHAISALLPWCREVLVVAGQGEPLVFPEEHIRMVNDRIPAGPLGGLEAGLRAMRSRHAVVVACDMPFLDGALLQFLGSLCDGFDAVVPVWEQRPQPLHAVYGASCLPVLDGLLDSGVVPALRDLLDRLHVRFVTASELTWFPDWTRSFMNINTPADLAAARARP